MGRGEQDEPAGKSGITSGQRTGGVVSCGPFKSRGVVEMPDISSASRLVIFSVFCLAGISLFIFAIDFPTYFATVADRFAMRGRALEEMARN